MLGLGDFSIFLAYILCVASAVLCVVYGIVNWNKGNEPEADIEKDTKWETEDTKIKDELDI